mgnify:CR=1 FL=1
MTDTELKLIAAAAIIGESKTSIPIRNKTPAAIGTPIVLYIKAKKRFCLMLSITAWLKFFALTIPCKSPFTKVISELSTQLVQVMMKETWL